MRVRTYSVLIVFSVALFLFMNWTDGGFTGQVIPVMAQSTEKEQSIPEEAVRLRILANSDSREDQWLKRKVRDEIIKEVETWADKPQSAAEASRLIRARLPKLDAIAGETVDRYGYSYPVQVKFGKVPFPTKLYGDQIYPAGKYEALLITIGEGKGDNWWCVLFPPLCFVDMSNGDAVRQSDARAVAAGKALAAPAKSEAPTEPESRAEIRFFLLDSLENLFSGWFQS
ncbi:MAG: stage II sporulation protein R [Firmicutes bacterium]|uniref:Stage II sporulation protein R n=1 Tax=Melghirimyces thermohalophilus TaxID=1236220 RepID=A0A1G6MB78_9BACL|nr:stage II sporulation protein R [Melghirimyces thermohalophilus]MDA8352589.1 stage II sporulation protein R [Bacillota bacterium]SDC52577.1 stage II sporulation protein R [Melghirimyces thermohalophilus]